MARILMGFVVALMVATWFWIPMSNLFAGRFGSAEFFMSGMRLEVYEGHQTIGWFDSRLNSNTMLGLPFLQAGAIIFWLSVVVASIGIIPFSSGRWMMGLSVPFILAALISHLIGYQETASLYDSSLGLGLFFLLIAAGLALFATILGYNDSSSRIETSPSQKNVSDHSHRGDDRPPERS